NCDEPALDHLSLAFALAYRRLEAFIHLAREQVAQRAVVALRIGKDDHLISRLRPAHEMLGNLSLRAMASRPPVTGDPGSAMPYQRSARSTDSVEGGVVSALLPGNLTALLLAPRPASGGGRLRPVR